MRYYIKINGVSSLTIPGLAIKTLPPISKPAMRNLREEIDGRDGDITTELGYGAYDRILEIGLFGSYDIDQIIAFFNSKGTIVFSDEPDKYYNFEIVDRIDYTQLVKFRTAMINIHCQPFKYPLEETPEEEEYEYVTGTGTNITLDNTEETLFNEIELQGNTSQQTYTGKNTFNLRDGTYTNNGMTAVVTDGVISLTGETSVNAFITINLDSNIEWTIGQSYTIAVFNPTINGNVRLRVNMGGGKDTGCSVIDSTQTINYTTTIDDIYTDKIQIRVQSGTTITTPFIMRPMRVIGSTAGDYEPYVGGIPSPNPNYPQDIHVVSGDNTIRITGRNQFDLTQGTNYHATSNINEDAITITSSGTWARTEFLIPVIPNQQYVFNCNYRNNTGKVKVNFYDGDTDIGGNTSSETTSGTITRTMTITSNLVKVQMYSNFTNNSTTTSVEYYDVQFQKGETPSQYEPYTGETYTLSLGSLEMASIPNTDFKDYFKKEEDKWYKVSQLKKHLVKPTDGTIEVNGIRFSGYSPGVPNQGYPNLICTHLRRAVNYDQAINMSNTKENANKIALNTSGIVLCNIAGFTTKNNYLDFFTNNNVYIYFVTQTETETEITDETLAGQLEALWNANSYRGQTNITQTSNDLPFMMEVSALKLGSDHLIISNGGNIFASPTISLEGTGVVDIYLNDVQVFQVDLTEVNKIVIDTEAMEAYNPDTNALANRQVTGDYSKMKLAPGSNDLRFSGALTSAEVTRYKRWL